MPKRVKAFFQHGHQFRIIFLVAGSLLVLLVFGGFHGIFLAETSLNEEAYALYKPELYASTGRLFIVGALYILVVSLAAAFLSHRAVGPLERLEKEVSAMAESPKDPHPLEIRESDEMTGVIQAINQLIQRMKKRKKA